MGKIRLLLIAFFYILCICPTGLRAQYVFLHAPLVNYLEVYEGDDTTLAVIMAVGKDSVNFSPDPATHKYSLLSNKSSKYVLLSSGSGSFTGYDTLRFSFHAQIDSTQYTIATFIVDDTLVANIELYATVLRFYPLKLANDVNAKLGSRALRYIGLESVGNNPGVVVRSISLAGDGSVSLLDSSLHLPWNMDRGQCPFWVYANSKDSFQTHSARVTVVTSHGNGLIDTTVSTLQAHYTYPFDDRCIAVDNIQVDRVNPFQILDTSVTLRNFAPLDAIVIHADLPTPDSSLSFDTTQFPIRIKPRDSVRFHIKFNPRPTEHGNYYHSYLNFTLGSKDSDGFVCPGAQSTIEMMLPQLEADTANVFLISPDSTPIRFDVGLANFRDARVLRIVNNTAEDHRIMWPEFLDSTDAFYFGLWNYSKDTILHPGGSFLAGLIFDESRGEHRYAYPSHLVFHYEDSTISWKIPLYVETHFSVKQKVVIPPSITVAPNPANSLTHVRIGECRTAQIDLIDLLGRTILRKDRVSDPADIDLDLAMLSPGSYFLRLSGLTSEGSDYVVTKRLSVQR